MQVPDYGPRKEVQWQRAQRVHQPRQYTYTLWEGWEEREEGVRAGHGLVKPGSSEPQSGYGA
jgi:hypothetical protein